MINSFNGQFYYGWILKTAILTVRKSQSYFFFTSYMSSKFFAEVFEKLLVIWIQIWPNSIKFFLKFNRISKKGFNQIIYSID